jgi:membrane-bound lytic murein transglycosylase D
MAAYNCGPGRVAAAQAANRRSGKPTDYWSLNLPDETKQYVPQILATARLVAAPTRYGLNLPPVPDRPQLEVIRTLQPVDLSRVASATGVQLYDLQRLNPALKLGRTAPDGPGYILVPAGSGQRIGKKMGRVQVMPAMASVVRSRAGAAPTGTAQTSTAIRSKAVRAERRKIHVVKGGETIASIARANGIEPRTLAELNGISVREPLLSGQTLEVHATDDSALITHVVTKGDSVKTLAKHYGVSVKDLQRWNRLAETRLTPGDLILIYPPGRAPTS